MGFDLFGRRAKSERGAYFRNNVWWWRPLAEYILANVNIPDEEARNWQYNDGTVVSEETALHIADTLEGLIAQGHTQRYKEQYRKRRARLPLVECPICHGLGLRPDNIVKGTCNTCAGEGKVQHWDTHYHFDTENVKEFAKFCRDSGGFRIC
jgi:hypothetical protein